MEDKINIEEVFQEILDLYIETKDIEEAVEIYFDNQIKEFEGEIDFSELKSIIISQVKASKTLTKIENENKEKEILCNTLNQFDYQFEDEQIENKGVRS